MSHAMVTIAAPIAADQVEQAAGMIAGLGNPAGDELRAALDRLDGDDGVHFVSLHAIAPDDPQGRMGHLVLELSADGADDTAIERLVDRIGDRLQPVFALATDRGGAGLGQFLKSHTVGVGHGWFDPAGLAFAGTPGMSVGRIRQEAKLGEALTSRLEHQDAGFSALDRLDGVRAAIRKDPAFSWALETPASLPQQPDNKGLKLYLALAASFATTYLWPLAIVAALIAAGLIMAALNVAATGRWAPLAWMEVVVVAFVGLVLAAPVALYLSLRSKESSDWAQDAAPRRDILRRILEHENQGAQNHMISVTTIKPGVTRMVTLRIVFWAIGQLARLSFKPGRLQDIGTIHFARWVTLPKSRQLVFFSNYGGSWESYLEDFITKAHKGLTAVWSNTVGFPRTENLIQKGATDGERFKRYARHSMQPTPFWYSAYPALTTANIRTNAAMRCGLAAAMTDEEATAWLALFGSAARPAVKLESNQIQSLVFGGLGFMPHGELLLIDLNSDVTRVRDWLRAIHPHIAFDDGRRLRRDAVLTVALGPGGLAKAGLPDDALESFPAAFLDGMTGPGRSRILGDHPEDQWWWTSGTHDVALLVYGEHEGAASALASTMAELATGHGHTIGRVIPLEPVAKTPSDRTEPFGFLDGVSQPVIRGTYKGLRSADPIHLVEPGEFILGYPDNRGNVPPGPTLRSLDDPDNRLPIRIEQTDGFASTVVDAPREIGRNGSFLVIRQLEQDHDAFWSYCDGEAGRLQGRLGVPYVVNREFIGAKLVGRWPDGSSLVRNPYTSFTSSDPREKSPTRRPASNPSDQAVIAPAPTGHLHAPAGGDPGDNDFLYGAEDPQALRCPFGAHIRRANPRDSLDPGSQDQVDISNRHRILRVGRGYVAQEGQKPGLMFMCLNGDIERQFEFVQQTWLGSPTFHGLTGERDPLAGDREGCPRGYTVPTRDGPIRLAPISRFVTPRGGGYFFLPGKRLLEFLGDGPAPPQA